MRKGKKQVEGGRNIVLTWREERWNLSSYSFWSGEWCYVRLEEMHTGKQTTIILTEGRKIIWLENTHWHMLSSISVALTQKLITTWNCGKKESCSNGKNTFKFQLFHSVTSWRSLSLLVQRLVSCTWSHYIHPVHGTHILMAQCLEINMIKSYCFFSLDYEQ